MIRVLGALAAILMAGVVAPRPAQACGGFFCSTVPVDQTGETIVYGLEADGTVTMTVQVDYQGMDDDFAWVLPVVAPPTDIDIGSPALFDALTRATNPMFLPEGQQTGVCRDHPRCVYESGYDAYDGGGCGSSSSGEWRGGYVDASAADASMLEPSPVDAGVDMGVTVFSEATVGPYDTVTLGAATAMEVVEWLQTNDYDVPDASIALLEPYAAAGQVFVALRLSANANTGVLRPVVLRIPSSEACLPIQLTAIATVPNMPITAFFLGREGARSTNYSEAIVDTTDPAFWDGSNSWRNAVRTAVDDLGGQAFATEYSGATPLVGVELPSVLDLGSQSDAGSFLSELRTRGYAGDPLMLELFERFIAPPTGTPEARDYYNCIVRGSVATCGEPSRFDPGGLAAAINAEVTRPRAEAQALVERHGHLTRLYTEMGPEDMTLDPVFEQDPRVPDYDNVHRATRVTDCSPEYYPEDAAQHWEIDGMSFPIRVAGRRADDERYCRDLGAVPADSAEGRMALERREESGGCLCATVGVGTTPGGFVGAILLAFLFRRHRRRSRGGKHIRR